MPDFHAVNNTSDTLVIIVVPFNDWNEWVLDCARHCAALAWSNWNMWLLPDSAPSPEWAHKLSALNLGDRVHIEPTGPGNPARKRNVALRKSRATIFALVDSDAWPAPEWLVTALPLLKGDVAVVAGPNLTPPDDPLDRRVPGRIMESPLGFGGGYIRHTKVSRRIVREMPTCNMILRRIDGLMFREDLETGEDMVYCSDVRSRGLSILYDPDVIVFHHRRRMGIAFLSQFYKYGLDKGRLARRSSDIAYVWQSFPALFLLYLAGLALATAAPAPALIHRIAWIPMWMYGAAVLVESFRRSKSVGELILAPLGFLVAHAGYGAGYLQGVFSRSKPQ